MNSIKYIAIIFLLLVSCNTLKKHLPLRNAHAHNDYEHDKPLFDALENGFVSIEADVHLINDELYVSHFAPEKLDSLKTLESLYLKPLYDHINKNKGRVYDGYDGFFYLMIDIKTEAEPSYKKLKQILIKYEQIISLVRDGIEETHKPVKIVITGMKGRPFKQILADEPKFCSLDGRLSELGQGIKSEVMPYISENYKHYLSFSGIGSPSEKDIDTLRKIVKAVHKENKKLRFWASPDNPQVWTFLLNHEVDLINTDSLPKFREFMVLKKK